MIVVAEKITVGVFVRRGFEEPVLPVLAFSIFFQQNQTELCAVRQVDAKGGAVFIIRLGVQSGLFVVDFIELTLPMAKAKGFSVR